jgi:AcrR family transcriptional regulator
MPRTAPYMPRKLAQAAFEQFAGNSIDNVSLDQIAAHAGVTKGSIYCHYKSKHDLILAACSYYYRCYLAKVHGEIAAITDPLERLMRVLELSVHTCVLDRGSRAFTTEIFALSLLHDDIRASWAQFYDSVREMYVGLTAAVKSSGQLEVEDPCHAVDMMLAAIEGIKLRATFEPHIAANDEQRHLVRGLLAILGRVPPSTSQDKNFAPDDERITRN